MYFLLTKSLVDNPIYMLLLFGILFYFTLVGYIFFWLTDYFHIAIGMNKLLSMGTFLCLLLFAIVLGLVCGGKVGDHFVNFNI